jgi:hypothetical protein
VVPFARVRVFVAPQVGGGGVAVVVTASVLLVFTQLSRV